MTPGRPGRVLCGFPTRRPHAHARPDRLRPHPHARVRRGDRQAAGRSPSSTCGTPTRPGRPSGRPTCTRPSSTTRPSPTTTRPSTGVIVCAETDRHESRGDAGRARPSKPFLFVEKPLGYAAADAALMADAIAAAGITFQTGYFRRGDPKHLFLKRQIDAGAFGKITRVRGSNCHSGALGGWFDAKPTNPADDWRWMADPKVAGCGAFGDLGTHMIDVMIWLCGDVTAATAQLDVGTNRYAGCDETGEGLLRFKSPARSARSPPVLGRPGRPRVAGRDRHRGVRLRPRRAPALPVQARAGVGPEAALDRLAGEEGGRLRGVLWTPSRGSPRRWSRRPRRPTGRGWSRRCTPGPRPTRGRRCERTFIRRA